MNNANVLTALVFSSVSQMLETANLENMELNELREIANLSGITNYVQANKKALIKKIEIHYNQAELLNERIKRAEQLKAEQEALNTPPAGFAPEIWATFTNEQKQAISGTFKAVSESKPKGNTSNGPLTTVPYTELPIGTVLSKNGTVLLVAGQPKPGVTLLASVKLAWHNTNPNVTGIGSTVLVQGTGTLPANFEDTTMQLCLNKANALLADNKAKEVKQALKDLLALNNSNDIPTAYSNFIVRMASKLLVLSAIPVTETNPEQTTAEKLSQLATGTVNSTVIGNQEENKPVNELQEAGK